MSPIEDCVRLRIVLQCWLFCMLGGSMEVDILFQFGGGQTHFGMPSGVEMSLALNVPIKIALYLNSSTTSKHAPQVGKL